MSVEWDEAATSLLNDITDIAAEHYDVAVIDPAVIGNFAIPYKLGMQWIIFAVPFFQWKYRSVIYIYTKRQLHICCKQQHFSRNLLRIIIIQ